MATVQRRLVADPSIGIGDLMKGFQKFVEETGQMDLFGAVDPPTHHTWSWKTAPNISWMAKIHLLALHLLDVAPNGVLASSKLKNSVVKLCGWKKINKTRFADCDFADQVDLRVRVVLAQFRLLKQKADEYQKAMRKATPEEKEQVDKVISKLVLETMETPDGPVSNKDLQMVPVKKPLPSNPSSSSAMVATSAEPISMGFSNVLKELLEKDFSSPAKEVAPSQHVPSAPSKPTVQLSRSLARTFSNFNCVPPEDVTSSEGTPQLKKKRRGRASHHSLNQRHLKQKEWCLEGQIWTMQTWKYCKKLWKKMCLNKLQ